jgi:hypothetical protein
LLSLTVISTPTMSTPSPSTGKPRPSITSSLADIQIPICGVSPPFAFINIALLMNIRYPRNA